MTYTRSRRKKLERIRQFIQREIDTARLDAAGIGEIMSYLNMSLYQYENDEGDTKCH